MKGEISIDARAYLSENGFFAYNLEGGYGKWLIQTMEEDDDKPDCAAIELSIRKKFHKQIFSKFTKAINEYQLLKEGDKVAVCISGGKDSMLMAKLFQELQRRSSRLVYSAFQSLYFLLPIKRVLIWEHSLLLQLNSWYRQRRQRVQLLQCVPVHLDGISRWRNCRGLLPWMDFPVRFQDALDVCRLLLSVRISGSSL